MLNGAKEFFIVRRTQIYLAGLFTIFVVLYIFIAISSVPPSSVNLNRFAIAGGSLGAACSLIVIIDILVQKRRGPMKLVFWHAIMDFGIAVRFLSSTGFNILTCDGTSCSVSGPNNCAFASAFLEFFEIGSECWFCNVGLELLLSIVNPFTSIEARLGWYHIWTLSTAFAFAIPTGVVETVNGYWEIDDDVDSVGICWIGLSRDEIASSFSVPFLFVYMPIISVYVFALAVLTIAYQRLRSGIPQTVIHRMKAFVINATQVMIYIFYWLVAAIVYAFAYARIGIAGERGFLQFLVFWISAKGTWVLVIWILSLDTDFGPKNSNNGGTADGDDEGQRVDLNAALRQEVLHFATLGIRYCAKKGKDLDPNQCHQVVTMEHKEQTSKDSELSLTFFFFLVLGRQRERDEVKRLAKRARSFQSSSSSNITVGRDSNPNERASDRDMIGMSMVSIQDPSLSTISLPSRFTVNAQSSSSRITEAIIVREDLNDAGHHDSHSSWLGHVGDCIKETFGFHSNGAVFTEFEPYHFRRVRQAAGISDANYIKYFETTIKERLTQGGASGAFFFFSKDEVFIAKSCTEEELNTLKDNAETYADYLSCQDGRDSLISKIYGAYMLKIYGSALYFFVMNNLFFSTDDLAIHEKYDIKGSWVNRSATPPSQGQLVTCRKCEQKYVHSSARSRKSHNSDVSCSSVVQALLQGRWPWRDASESASGSGSGSGPGSMFQNSFAGKADRRSEDDKLDMCGFTVSGEHEPSTIMKDNDLKYKIRLPKEQAQRLLRQLTNDADFLHRIGVMDYSLLVGVHNTEYVVRADPNGDFADEAGVGQSQSNGQTSSRSASPMHASHISTANDHSGSSSPRQVSAPSRPASKIIDERENFRSTRLEVQKVVGPQAYQMGIIDFQQKWDWNKKWERFAKINMQGADPQGLSAVEPAQYRERFVNKMADILGLEPL